jgi:hypothetical protein
MRRHQATHTCPSDCGGRRERQAPVGPQHPMQSDGLQRFDRPRPCLAPMILIAATFLRVSMTLPFQAHRADHHLKAWPENCQHHPTSPSASGTASPTMPTTRICEDGKVFRQPSFTYDLLPRTTTGLSAHFSNPEVDFRLAGFSPCDAPRNFRCQRPRMICEPGEQLAPALFRRLGSDQHPPLGASPDKPAYP